jgi:hypothetical protein
MGLFHRFPKHGEIFAQQFRIIVAHWFGVLAVRQQTSSEKTKEREELHFPLQHGKNTPRPGAKQLACART